MTKAKATFNFSQQQAESFVSHVGVALSMVGKEIYFSYDKNTDAFSGLITVTSKGSDCISKILCYLKFNVQEDDGVILEIAIVVEEPRNELEKVDTSSSHSKHLISYGEMCQFFGNTSQGNRDWAVTRKYEGEKVLYGIVYEKKIALYPNGNFRMLQEDVKQVAQKINEVTQRD